MSVCVWCKVLSCVGKMTLAQLKRGFSLRLSAALLCSFLPPNSQAQAFQTVAVHVLPGGGGGVRNALLRRKRRRRRLAYFHSYLCAPHPTPPPPPPFFCLHAAEHEAALIQAKSNPAGRKKTTLGEEEEPEENRWEVVEVVVVDGAGGELLTIGGDGTQHSAGAGLSERKRRRVSARSGEQRSSGCSPSLT